MTHPAAVDFSAIPSVDSVVRDAEAAGLVARFGRVPVTEASRAEIGAARSRHLGPAQQPGAVVLDMRGRVGDRPKVREQQQARIERSQQAESALPGPQVDLGRRCGGPESTLHDPAADETLALALGKEGGVTACVAVEPQ